MKATKKASKTVKKPSLKKISLTKEPLSNAGSERWACQECGLYTGEPSRPQVPEDWTGKLLIVGDNGNLTGRAFSLLRKLWRSVGYTDSDVACFSSVRCSGPKAANMNQVRACRPFLLTVLAKLNPKFVLAAGATAFRAIKNDGSINITRNRGKQLKVEGL